MGNFLTSINAVGAGAYPPRCCCWLSSNDLSISVLMYWWFVVHFSLVENIPCFFSSSIWLFFLTLVPVWGGGLSLASHFLLLPLKKYLPSRWIYQTSSFCFNTSVCYLFFWFDNYFMSLWIILTTLGKPSGQMSITLNAGSIFCQFLIFFVKQFLAPYFHWHTSPRQLRLSNLLFSAIL